MSELISLNNLNLSVVNDSIQKENEIDITSDIDTIYNFLLDELFETLEKNQEFILPDKDEKISKPDTVFDISKRTVWKNFKTIQEQINREEGHLLKFFNLEYKKTTSINKNGHFLIVGKYMNMIPNTLKKYIKIYVQCGTCKSIKTSIIKNHRMGLDYKKCTKCDRESPIIDK